LIVDFTPRRSHAVPGRGKNEKKKGLPRSRWIAQLGPRDQLVEWFCPPEVPAWMSAESFAALPATLRVRELGYTLARPGFRVHQVTLVTTLLDPQVYTAERLAEVYGLRWTIEVYQPECPSSAGLYQLAA
jgi:IS4 transposase